MPMQVTVGCPLTAADLKQLNTSLYVLNQLVEAIEKAKRAGVDCSQVEQMRTDLYEQASRIKREYFPNAN